MQAQFIETVFFKVYLSRIVSVPQFKGIQFRLFKPLKIFDELTQWGLTYAPGMYYALCVCLRKYGGPTQKGLSCTYKNS